MGGKNSKQTDVGGFNQLEDSISVRVKKDRKATEKKGGTPNAGFVPRKPLEIPKKEEKEAAETKAENK